MKKIVQLGWTAIIVLMTASCNGNTQYHTYRPVAAAGWHRGDTLYFTIPSGDSTANTHQWTLGIRHKDSYAYRDIWLTLNGDTVHLQLADSLGYWYGNGIGELRQYTHAITPPDIRWQDSITEIRITHIMQDNPLKGIHDIGLQISNR